MTVVHFRYGKQKAKIAYHQSEEEERTESGSYSISEGVESAQNVRQEGAYWKKETVVEI